MTTLIMISLVFNAILLALWFGLWFSTKLVDAKAKTSPEAAVRLLHCLGRRGTALAEALDSGILCYREMTREDLKSRSEVERQLRKALEIRKSMEAWRP
jgi:hypothetical protein